MCNLVRYSNRPVSTPTGRQASKHEVLVQIRKNISTRSPIDGRQFQRKYTKNLQSDVPSTEYCCDGVELWIATWIARRAVVRHLIGVVGNVLCPEVIFAARV